MSDQQQRILVARHFLLSSPPGQIAEVDKDVSLLLAPAAELNAAQRTNIYREKAMGASTLVTLPSTTPTTPTTPTTLLVCPEGEMKDGSGRLVSSVNGHAYTYNYITGAIEGEGEDVSSSFFPCASSSSPTPPSETLLILESYRKEATKALTLYTAAAYAPVIMGTSTTAIRGAEVFHNTANDSSTTPSSPSSSTAVDGAGGGGAGAESSSSSSSLVILTSVLVRNIKSFWAGSLRTRFIVTLTSPTTASLSGTVKFVTHAFESGNVQMKDKKTIPSSTTTTVTFPDGTPASFALALVRAIAVIEDTILTGFDDTYDALSGASLKEIRRALPISGSKFTWNIGSHRMVRSLQQQQQQVKP